MRTQSYEDVPTPRPPERYSKRATVQIQANQNSHIEYLQVQNRIRAKLSSSQGVPGRRVFQSCIRTPKLLDIELQRRESTPPPPRTAPPARWILVQARMGWGRAGGGVWGEGCGRKRHSVLKNLVLRLINSFPNLWAATDLIEGTNHIFVVEWVACGHPGNREP